MLNNASNKIQVPLSGPLNLSANKIQTTDYTGYNNNNGAIYKNTLHPYYKGVHEGQYYKDLNGVEYSLVNNKFSIDGTLAKTFNYKYSMSLVDTGVQDMNILAYKVYNGAAAVVYSDLLGYHYKYNDVEYFTLAMDALHKYSFAVDFDIVNNYPCVAFGCLDTQYITLLGYGRSTMSGIFLYWDANALAYTYQSLHGYEIMTYPELTCQIQISLKMQYRWIIEFPSLVDYLTLGNTSGINVFNFQTSLMKWSQVGYYKGTAYPIMGGMSYDGYIMLLPASDSTSVSYLEVGSTSSSGSPNGSRIVTYTKPLWDTDTSTSNNYHGGVFFANNTFVSVGIIYTSTSKLFRFLNLSLDTPYTLVFEDKTDAIDMPSLLNESITVQGVLDSVSTDGMNYLSYHSWNQNWKYGYLTTVGHNWCILALEGTFDPYFDTCGGYFKSKIDGKIYRGITGSLVKFHVVDNNIIFNSTECGNMYNTLLKRWENYALDYDEHIVRDIVTLTYSSSTYKLVYPTQRYTLTYMNGLYTLSNWHCSSLISNPLSGYSQDLSLSNVKIAVRAMDMKIPQGAYTGIQLFQGTLLKAVSYIGRLMMYQHTTSSIPYYITMADGEYDGTTLVVDTENASLYPVSICLDFIQSYSNHDMESLMGLTLKLQYYNGTARYLYKSSDVYENTTLIFSIRATQYAVVYDTIYELSSYTPIVSVAHMKFIGANTSTAYFYSYQDGAIYTFDGNITIQYLMPLDAIGDVNEFAYNTGNGALIIATDNGLTVINSNTEQHFIPEDTAITQLYLNNNSVFAYNGTNTNVYSESDATVGDVLPLDVSTCYYKSLGQKIVNTDCFYIKLYANAPKDGTVKCSASFLLDKLSTTPTQTYSIKAADWKDSPYISLRYQPKYNLNDGISLNITSDFPILSIEAGVTQTASNGVTRINI